MTDGSEPARLDARVRGRVQGVGFRYFVLGEARRLRLTGWVSNEHDRSVRCVAEGPRGDLEILLAELHEGPPASNVNTVDVRWLPATGEFDGFGVRLGGHAGD